MLSQKAKEIVDILEKVSICQDLENFVEQDEQGNHWLPMCNICNGHVDHVPENILSLMNELSDVLHGNLIGKRGHSDVYYELKKAGYSLRTAESDSFGPLSAVITVPNKNWKICYG